MAEATLEKAICDNCGVDVRENTQFCYNCGKSVVGDVDEAQHTTADSNGTGEPEMSEDARSALDDLALKLKAEDKDNAELLAQAAAERKKARVKPRRKNEVVWESVEDGSDRIFILTTLLICTIAAAIVFIMVFWK
jgi:predicted amidophosphoribosyltransferase